MTSTSTRRQPYFQRVTVPGMSPHFEPTAPQTADDSFFHPRPRLRAVPTPAPRPEDAGLAAPGSVEQPSGTGAGHPVWNGQLDAVAPVPRAHGPGRRGAWILAALLGLAAGVGAMAWREIAALW